MQQIVLPNGLAVLAPNAVEAAVVYREVVSDATYISHGITLGANAIVFDVGANVGIFAMHVAQQFPDARVYAFEPIPKLFNALQRNVAAHAPGVHVYNAGLASHAGEATFEIDKFMTIAATMHPRVFDRTGEAPAATWAAAAIADMERVAPSKALRLIAAGLAHNALRPLVLAAMTPVAAVLGLRRWIFLERVRCQLVTLSQALATSGESEITLLKIDVEGAEEQVMAGIDAADWPRIQQLVIEVHDVDGRLARMTQALEQFGFQVTHAREDWALHELLRISTLYAIRRDV